MFRSKSIRRSLAIAFFTPIAVLVASGALIYGSVAAQESTPTPAGVLEGDAVSVDCSTIDGVATTYSLVSDESEVRYVAQEELANQGAVEAVGATNAVIGQILFDETGVPMVCSRFDVDLRTLTSDESRRDNHLRGNTLETDTYPLATFILTSVEGLDAELVEGEETTITLIGNLEMHGVTKSVAWTATVTLEGDSITGSAETSFDMPEFNIEPPKVGPVLSLDEHVVLQIDLTLAKDA